MVSQPQTPDQLAVNGKIWLKDLLIWKTGTHVCAECGDLLLGQIEKQIGLCPACHRAEGNVAENAPFVRMIYKSRGK